MESLKFIIKKLNKFTYNIFNTIIVRTFSFTNFNPELWEGQVDYFRIIFLELISNELNNNNLDGSVAELGVYQGDFAKLINRAFPNRKLYLFDTFEGFKGEAVKIDREKQFSKADQDFSNTSEEIVMNKMFYPENVIIKKGIFPDTATGIENEKFCFVSIDVDLYKPTYEGLQFFYPKLVRGGDNNGS